jgi:hypothetical protein
LSTDSNAISGKPSKIGEGVSRCAAGVFRGGYLCHCARGAEEIQRGKKNELLPN